MKFATQKTIWSLCFFCCLCFKCGADSNLAIDNVMHKVQYSVQDGSTSAADSAKLQRFKATNNISYKLAGFGTNRGEEDRWNRAIVNVEMTGTTYTLLRLKLGEEYESFPSMGYAFAVHSFFPYLSGCQASSNPGFYKDWSETVKPQFEKVESSIKRDLGEEHQDLWNIFWQNETLAKVFFDFFMGFVVINPIDHNWKKLVKKPPKDYVTACRAWGADFNLKFDRNGEWDILNSFLMVAHYKIPQSIRNIWYETVRGVLKTPHFTFEFLPPKSPNITVSDVQGELFKVFSKWLIGQVIYPPCYFNDEDLSKEIKDGEVLNLKFIFRSIAGEGVTIDKLAVQEANVRFYFRPTT